MRIFHIVPGTPLAALQAWPESLPETGYFWLSVSRSVFREQAESLQAALHRRFDMDLLDPFIANLLNPQMESRFDDAPDCDVMSFRQLAAGWREQAPPSGPDAGSQGVLPVATDTAGFVLGARMLLSVHPDDCPLRTASIEKLQQQALGMLHHENGNGGIVGTVRLPQGPADLMLRLIGHIVDDFLELRKTLTRELDDWQRLLLRPRARFENWDALLRSRQVLHYLDDCCEDQRNALNAWMDTLESWPVGNNPAERREREMLLVRCRDVQEHIDHVAHHVQRLEQSAETAVQIHFNIQGNRTNDVMRMLTAVAAVFLPLGLIADLFGMGVAAMPWLHSAWGFWLTLGIMLVIATCLLMYFMNKHYLSANDDAPKRSGWISGKG